MKIIEPCNHDDKTFGVISSRWAKLPRVHIEVEDEGGKSIWHGYDNNGEPLKECLFIPSPEFDRLNKQALANSTKKLTGPIDQLKAEIAQLAARLDSLTNKGDK